VRKATKYTYRRTRSALGARGVWSRAHRAGQRRRTVVTALGGAWEQSRVHRAPHVWEGHGPSASFISGGGSGGAGRHTWQSSRPARAWWNGTTGAVADRAAVCRAPRAERIERPHARGSRPTLAGPGPEPARTWAPAARAREEGGARVTSLAQRAWDGDGNGARLRRFSFHCQRRTSDPGTSVGRACGH
jgi:hypothetical protein